MFLTLTFGSLCMLVGISISVGVAIGGYIGYRSGKR